MLVEADDFEFHRFLGAISAFWTRRKMEKGSFGMR
jgi:hypothetical protein